MTLTALYWGLPISGTCVKQCAVCREPVIVLCRAGALVAEPCVALFDPSEEDRDGKRLHAHQPDPEWVRQWGCFVRRASTMDFGGSMIRSRKGRMTANVRERAGIQCVYNDRGRRIDAPVCDFGSLKG